MSENIIPVNVSEVKVYYDAEEKYYFATIVIHNKSITLKEAKKNEL